MDVHSTGFPNWCNPFLDIFLFLLFKCLIIPHFLFYCWIFLHFHMFLALLPNYFSIFGKTQPYLHPLNLCYGKLYPSSWFPTTTLKASHPSYIQFNVNRRMGNSLSMILSVEKLNLDLFVELNGT